MNWTHSEVACGDEASLQLSPKRFSLLFFNRAKFSIMYPESVDTNAQCRYSINHSYDGHKQILAKLIIPIIYCQMLWLLSMELNFYSNAR